MSLCLLSLGLASGDPFSFANRNAQHAGQQERRGSQREGRSQRKGALGEPPAPSPIHNEEKRMDPRTPEDISGHLGCLPGAGLSGQGHVTSSSWPCGCGEDAPHSLPAPALKSR